MVFPIFNLKANVQYLFQNESFKTGKITIWNYTFNLRFIMLYIVFNSFQYVISLHQEKHPEAYSEY